MDVDMVKSALETLLAGSLNPPRLGLKPIVSSDTLREDLARWRRNP